jgi:hypothetical protein
MEAVQKCRSAAAGEEGATYDSFSLISDRNYNPIFSLLHDLNVTDDEYATWKAAYEADTPRREARRRAKEGAEIREDIDACREWLTGEFEAFEAFGRLAMKAANEADGLDAFLTKHGISRVEWRQLNHLSSRLE